MVADLMRSPMEAWWLAGACWGSDDECGGGGGGG